MTNYKDKNANFILFHHSAVAMGNGSAIFIPFFVERKYDYYQQKQHNVIIYEKFYIVLTF
jgi:hypothetical protein